MKHLWVIFLIALAGLPACAATNTPAPERLVITSTNGFQGDMKNSLITYFGDVHVDDPQMKLTCDWLQANLPGAARHIVARTNVVSDLDAGQNRKWHVTCDQAVYDFKVVAGVTNEAVVLTGHAIAKNDQMTATGEPLIYDMVTKLFSGTNYEMTFNHTNSPGAKTNHVSPP